MDEVITLSEETRDPTRTVPRALLLALGISAVLYALLAIAAISVLGADGVTSSERPLADVMAHVAGPSGVRTMAFVALLTSVRSESAGPSVGYPSSRWCSNGDGTTTKRTTPVAVVGL